MRIKNIVLIGFISLLSLPGSVWAACTDMLNFEHKKLHSSQVIDFCESFNNKVLLVVNTASQCGFTPQFKELESLYQKYKDDGLEIIGFPSNDFRQEYQYEKETASVCFKNFGVTFTMVSPSSVKGPSQNDFFKALSSMTGKQPNWNFNKYLLSRDRQHAEHFSSTSSPLNGTLEKQIIQALNSQ